jgi:glycosyltransferase involved in cell wall biosynthesis
MKILYLITRSERGGGASHVLDLIRGFSQRVEVELATGEEGFLLNEARSMGLVAHHIPNLIMPMRPTQDMRALTDVIRLIRKTKPDLIHAHTSKAGFLGRLAGWACGVPVVFTAHTWCFAEGTSWHWKTIGTFCERVAALAGGPIINVSEANRQLALHYRIAPPPRLATIHNGIPDLPCPAAGAPERSTSHTPVILNVARFAPQKDQILLLEAAALISAPFRVQFAGTGPDLEKAQQRAAQLGLTERVEFLGDRGDVNELLARADIFALPTNWEGFPLSILEAMRAALPVIASDVGGVREAVIHGTTGFLVSRGATGPFRERLEQLLADAELRRMMGQAGRRQFVSRFTTPRMLEKTLDIYRQALALRAGAVSRSAPEFDSSFLS